jgi:hypothetical protein
MSQNRDGVPKKHVVHTSPGAQKSDEQSSPARAKGENGGTPHVPAKHTAPVEHGCDGSHAAPTAPVRAHTPATHASPKLHVTHEAAVHPAGRSHA